MSTSCELQKEAMNKINKLYKEISCGDFSAFDLLTENQKIEFMQNWSQEMWDKYHTRNEITEDEVFDAIYKIIEDD